MIIIVIILIVIVLGLSYGCYNLLKQAEQLEETVTFYQTSLDFVREKVLQTEVTMKELDIRGAFEADDEVGTAFKNIKEVHTELTKSIQQIYESGN